MQTDATTDRASSAANQELAGAVRQLLETDCWECHGSTKQAGDLRLDSPQALARGGHSGSLVIGATPAASELFLRVTSDDPDYRMPRQRPPLSKPKIELIQRWIAAGAPAWPTTAVVGGDRGRNETNETEGNASAKPPPWFDRLERVLRPLRPLTLPLLLLLLGIWWLESGQYLRRAAVGPSPRPNPWRPSRWHYVWLGSMLLFAAAWLTTRAELETARRELDVSRQRAGQGPSDSSVPSRSELGGPLPVRPKHPPRLGGIYYRGNDERDPQLYNGGFYRTAELRLWLADAEHRELSWGSPVGSGDLWIGLQIKRAQSATPQLFTPRIMETVFLSRRFETAQGVLGTDEPVRLTPMISGEAWEAFYPIGNISAAPGGRLAGVIYLYKARERDQVDHAKFHFGIRYDIRTDGTSAIATPSEIWMNALSWPFGVEPPIPGRMTADEWFDFRPIPEIVGENSQDPGLLGIPEYLGPDPTPPQPLPADHAPH